MEYFNNELISFCKTNNFDDAIIILRKKLTKKYQMNQYDLIYTEFIENNSLDSFNVNTIIPGLKNVIKLMVFSQIYKHLLYNTEVSINAKILTLLLKCYKKYEFSVKSFLDISAFLCQIYDDNPSGVIKFELPTNRFCFPYVLIHKAGNLNFYDLSNMLFNPEFTKLPIAFKLFFDNTGPHGGYFVTPFMFFEHDFGHMEITLSNIARYDINKIINYLSNDNSFRSKCLKIYFIVIIFERAEIIYNNNNVVYKYDNLDPLVEFNDLGDIILLSFDFNDIIWVFKYLFSSTDITDYSDDYLSLIDNYNKFTLEYDNILIKLRESISDQLNGEFNPEKYTDLIGSSKMKNEDDIKDYIQDISKIKSTEFINDNLKVLFNKIRV